ncbi:MAG: hypothetical protein WC184_12620 [Acidimicrobiia bacterium]
MLDGKVVGQFPIMLLKRISLKTLIGITLGVGVALVAALVGVWATSETPRTPLETEIAELVEQLGPLGYPDMFDYHPLEGVTNPIRENAVLDLNWSSALCAMLPQTVLVNMVDAPYDVFWLDDHPEASCMVESQHRQTRVWFQVGLLDETSQIPSPWDGVVWQEHVFEQNSETVTVYTSVFNEGRNLVAQTLYNPTFLLSGDAVDELGRLEGRQRLIAAVMANTVFGWDSSRVEQEALTRYNNFLETHPN